MNDSPRNNTSAHGLPRCIAFAGSTRLAAGAPGEVAAAVRRHLDRPGAAPVCVLDARTSAPLDFLMEGTPEEVADRAERQLRARADQAAAVQKARRGRPRLGVTAKEVTLLPRHWDWLAAQPGGASVTLRKLVEAARKQGGASERIRQTQDTVHRFLYAVAGDLPGFEEVARALYAWDRERLEGLLAAWPPDVAGHARALLARGEEGATDEEAAR